MQEEESRAREKAQKMEHLNVRLQDKLSSYQELYDYHQRMIHLGTKVDKAAETYFQNGKKRPLISELLRIVETENSKRKKKGVEEQKLEKSRKDKAAKEAIQEVKKIRKQKAQKKKKQVREATQKPRPVLRVGDRVRLMDSKSVGSIDSIEKNKAIVNYGQFTTNVSLDQLELVESKK